MKMIRDAAPQQLAQAVNKLAIDKTACLFFIIGMILAAMILQGFIFTA